MSIGLMDFQVHITINTLRSLSYTFLRFNKISKEPGRVFFQVHYIVIPVFRFSNLMCWHSCIYSNAGNYSTVHSDCILNLSSVVDFIFA